MYMCMVLCTCMYNHRYTLPPPPPTPPTQRPAIDLVVSGINRGENCGLHIVYSGTVGAAREAAINVCDFAWERVCGFDACVGVWGCMGGCVWEGVFVCGRVCLCVGGCVCKTVHDRRMHGRLCLHRTQHVPHPIIHTTYNKHTK